MKQLLTLLCALCSLTAAAQDVLSLSGQWHFSIGATAPATYTDHVVLPGSMLTNGKGDDVSVHTQWTGSLYDSSFYFNPYMARYRIEGQMKFPFFLTPRKHYVGPAWYERTVVVPATWQNRNVTLYLERPHIETTVFVNGREADHQLSLSVPHQYDVTSLLQPGRENTITIKVYNGIENVCVGQDSHSVTDQTQGNWNGIAGRIELRAAPLIHRLRVEPDIASATARVLLNDTVITLRLERPLRLWSEHDPYLYTREVTYRGCRIPVTFGMREVAVNGREILLNGRAVRLRGTVENCCFPETGYPPTDVASWMRLLGKCKEYGLNHVRFHSYCPPDAAFTAADRLGIYLQPEGPSWPNHGVKLRRGMAIDQYLIDECKRIIDLYGAHPSLVMLAAGNEPAGDWVAWGRQFVAEMKAYDPSRIYCTASVGGGWQWDDGSQYHVKGGARGLEWDRRAPQTVDDFAAQLDFPRNYPDTQPCQSPIIAHEVGQWCAFPDFSEIPQYTGAYQPGNLEIFRDLLRDNGMASQAEKFLNASGRLQMLAYKYDIERNLRTPGYAGFQLLALNDYSGQGSALVGPLNVHWHEKAYCRATDWREFCSPVVPMARLPRFVYTTADTISFGISLYNTTADAITTVSYSLQNGQQCLFQGLCRGGDQVKFPPIAVGGPAKLTLRLQAGSYTNHYELWVYPRELPEADVRGIHITDTLDARALRVLRRGGNVLLCAAGKVRYGSDVRHTYLPVFWNTSWFKMRPPHTTGAYIDSSHPVFGEFPTDNWQNLNWWELVNGTQVINLAAFPAGYQPIVQPIDTWHVSRKLGMLIEARVLKGKLLMTTIDITSHLDQRVVARQLRHSILRYMASSAFRPTLTVSPEVISSLFTREAPPVNMFTNDSPDELKPKIGK